MDPALWEMLEEETNDEVKAIVRLRQPGLAPEQVRLVAQFGDVATCRLRRQAIPETRADEAVESLKASRLLTSELGLEPISLESDFPEDFQWNDERRPATLEATGRGVVVGVVDWGCDFAHPDFRHDDGTTRLLALWDQRGPAGPEVPHRYGYGTIHSAEAIDRALEADDPYAALGYHPAAGDPGGSGAHGTHVMGIAAGNGRGGGPVGLAPDCDLVFVHLASEGTGGLANLGDSVTFLEAVDFITRIAGERPCVINASVGRHGGPHDGSTLVEQGLDAWLVEMPGRAMVQSAGNYFNQRAHASGQMFPGGERTLVWWIDAADRTPNELEVWYSGRDTLVAEVHSPDGAVLGQVGLGDRASLEVDGREVGRIYHRAYDPNNHHHHINMFLDPGGPGGAWEVTLIGEDVVDGRFHAWVERDAGCLHCQSRFDLEDDDPASTTGTICNGFRTIAVGAYNPHSPEGELARFSSSGPTRDGRQKPDCTAPGVQILAPRSASQEPDVQPSLYTRKSGTSMAAPHVTGTIACMFEAAPRPLRIQETRNALLASARPASAPAEVMARVGSGYLDIEAAVEAARRIGEKTPPVETRSFAVVEPVVKQPHRNRTELINRENTSREREANYEPETKRERLMELDKNQPWPEDFDVETSSAETALESGKKRNFILISGGPGPYDNRDVEHDQSWANYVTPPLLLTDTKKKLKNFAEEDEEVWWFVYKPAHERRWKEDVKDPDRRDAVNNVRKKGFKSYVDMIEGRAKSRGWNLRWLHEADDLWKRLRTFKDPISRVWYWGHARDDLWLAVRHDEDSGEAMAPEPDEIITVDSIAANSTLVSRFQVGDLVRTHRFIGCNTAKFAQAWAKAFGAWAEGVDGFIHFKAIHKTGGEPCLVGEGQVKYFSPKGVHDSSEAWRAKAQPCSSLSLEALDDELSEASGVEEGLEPALAVQGADIKPEVGPIVDEWVAADEPDEEASMIDVIEEKSEAIMNDQGFEELFTSVEDSEVWEAHEIFAAEADETIAAEAYPYLERPAMSLVELADEAISSGAGSFASGGLLNHVLAEAAMADMFGSLGIYGAPSATVLFDAFTGHSPALGDHFEQFFEVVAYPGEQIPEELEASDMLIRRGEGGFAHLAVIADPQAFWADELAAAGLQAEAFGPGLFVQVVETGPFPHTQGDRFARRLTREGWRLDADNLILRFRPELVDFLIENHWDETQGELGLLDIDEEAQAIIETVLEPRAIPASDPVPFAPLPPAGSYWPIITTHPKGREVAYQAKDGSYEGRKGRSFLADRGGKRYHVGIDLWAHIDDEVVACEDGVIIGWRPFYKAKSGEMTYRILVEHPTLVVNYGEVKSYSLSRNGLDVGSTVKAGQVIGFISDTSMLHFETYRKGTKSPHRWMKRDKNPPSALLNPTKYLLFLQAQGLTGPRSEEPAGPSTPSTPSTPSIFSRFGALAERIQEALRDGLWAVAIRLAIQSGERNEIKLANMVFFARHPERDGRRIERGEPNFKALSKEWLDIRDKLVRPALAEVEVPEIEAAIGRGVRDEVKLANMVFFARHPERGGRRIERSESGFKVLSREWLYIRDRLVRPALAGGRGGPTRGAARGLDRDVEEILDYIRSEAQKAATRPRTVDPDSNFARVLGSRYLSKYLAFPSRATAGAAIEAISRQNTSGVVTEVCGERDYWEEATPNFNGVSVPAAIRSIPGLGWLPETIGAATEILTVANRRTLSYLDVPFLLGKRTIDLLDCASRREHSGDPDWMANNSINTSQLMHWATGAKYADLGRDRIRELFIAYELWHLEFWDVFGHDPLNDLIAEDAARHMAEQIAGLRMTRGNYIATLDEGFLEARAWVGALLRLRRDELDRQIKADAPPSALIHWDREIPPTSPMHPYGADTVRKLLASSKSVAEVKASSVVARYIEVYTLLFEADAWERTHGRIPLSILQRKMADGTLNSVFRALSAAERGGPSVLLRASGTTEAFNGDRLPR